MAVCSSCGSEVSGASKFCTACGAPVSAAPVAPSPTAFCTTCGSKLSPASRFCTGCGAPAQAAAPAAADFSPAQQPEPAAAVPAPAPAIAAAAAAPQNAEMPAQPSSAIPAGPVSSAAQSAASPALEPQPQAIPAYPAQPDYVPAPQPTGGGFRGIVLVLILVIILGGLGAWYFWGVETVIVCSPPDVRVFLDGQEVSTNSPGRYVLSHLSRKPHLLKVQSPGFADTVQRLDFPLTSLNEWVNITLVRSRQRR